ncbi:MAG: hypothetical protein V3U46_03175 [Acidimicrobiia bacterium]
MTDLLELMVEHTRSPLVVNQFTGAPLKRGMAQMMTEKAAVISSDHISSAAAASLHRNHREGA